MPYGRRTPSAQSMNARHERVSGFTLVELLVVVSIIALLIAILMPSLRGARRQARVAVCMEHLHGIGVAMWAYAEDNRRFLPPREPLGAHVYRMGPGKRLNSVDKNGQVTPGLFPECFGIAYILDQGQHVNLGNLSSTDPPPNPPQKYVSYARYIAGDSKSWLCPASTPPKVTLPFDWKELGNTYMFSLAMSGNIKRTSVMNEDGTMTTQNASNLWQIDRIKPSHNLLQDNSQFLPGRPGFMGPFYKYFLDVDQQVPPHPLGGGATNKGNRCYVALHADLRANLNQWEAKRGAY